MGAVVCSACGSSFAGSLRQRMVTCPSCGASVDQAVMRTRAAASPRDALDDETMARPSGAASSPATATIEASGRCPSCDAPGVVGAPCPERVCSLRSVHVIPEDYAAKVRADPGSADPLVGQIIAGYLVIDLLGQGGFGKVLLALQQPTYKLRAALKLFAPAAPDERTMHSLLDKFQNEAATLAVLEHPNIVRLLGHGTHGDRPWLAMEFVSNARTLEHALRNRVSPAMAKDVLVQLLNALEAAHGAGIVHRDIKPENVMLQSVVGSDHFVRLVDFGIAKTLDAGRKTSLVLGTPYYMAPEQLGGAQVGPWTDLYAVGVIAFELLTGKHLYGELTSEEVLRRKIDPSFDPLSLATDADLAPELREVLAKALCRNPTERYTSAAAMRHALEEALATKAVDTVETLRAERDALDAERRAFEDERRKVDAPPAPKKKGKGVKVAVALVVVALLVGGTVLAVKHFGSSDEAKPAASKAEKRHKPVKKVVVDPEESEAPPATEAPTTEAPADEPTPPSGDAEARARCEKQIEPSMKLGALPGVTAEQTQQLHDALMASCMLTGGTEAPTPAEP